jgi:hypothetical protein
MLTCNKCADEVPDPEQHSSGGLNSKGSRCRHIDCDGTYQD